MDGLRFLQQVTVCHDDRGELEVLQDWCFEAPYNILSTPIRTAQQMGYRLDSKVSSYSACGVRCRFAERAPFWRPSDLALPILAAPTTDTNK